MLADIIVDLQYGDCGKGKITHHLCRHGDYTHVLRYNGGCNAGHTIYHEGKKFVTHHIPAGVFFGVKSIIGSGCVVNPVQFFAEIDELEAAGIKTQGLVFIADNAHVITADHLAEDGTDTTIGTTKQGNGPAYRDKYARTGLQARDIPSFQPYLVNLYDEFHNAATPPRILCEGAQGFGLDIDHGDYPFVTSSHCTSAGALLNAIPPSWIRDVWGVGKIYETYVGQKDFEPNEPIFKEIRKIGEEFGATTGRPRQCNWMDLDLVTRALKINGVTKLVFNKVDVLRETDTWKLISGGKTVEFDSEEHMKDFLTQTLTLGAETEIFFSDNKNGI
jgi:adenylosuccinate synthase